MCISEQLPNPNKHRLRRSTQPGVGRVVLDNRGADLVLATGAVSPWDAHEPRAWREWVESAAARP